MRKLILAAFLLAAVPFAASAQGNLAVGGPGSNWEVNMAGGIHTMWDPQITPAFELGVSKWFTPQVGARLAWEGVTLEHNSAPAFDFAYIHADLLWNATQRLHGYDPTRRWAVIPYGHFGYLHEWRGKTVIEREYAAGAGFMARYRLAGRLYASLDLRATLLNNAGSQGKGMFSLIQTAQAGFSYTIGQDGWKTARRGETLLDGPVNHWFISAAGGVNSLSRLSFDFPQFTGSVAPAVEIAAGTWVTPSVGIRVGVQGISYAGHGDNPRTGVDARPEQMAGLQYREQFNFVYPHIDLLWDCATAFRGYDRERLVTVAPYAHFGAIWEYGQGRTIDREYAAGAGVLMQGPIAGALGWLLDLRGTAFTAAATGDAHSIHSMGLSGMAGLQYNLGDRKWQYQWSAPERRTGALPLFAADQGWFIQASAGARMLFNLGRGFKVHSVETPVASGEIAFGKWINPVSGIRLGYSGLTQITGGETAGYAAFHADYLFNALQWILPNERRIWNPIPYVYGGYLAGYRFADPQKHPEESGWIAGGGLLNTFRLFRQLDLTLDLRGTLIPPVAALTDNVGYMASAEALLGLQYRPDEKPWYKAEQAGNRKERHLWALSTNLVEMIAQSAVNLELMYSVSQHFTMDGIFRYGFQDTTPYDQRERFALGARWWPWHVYSGFWVRGLVQAEYYNRDGISARDGAGQAYGLSLSGGYSLMLTKWLDLDLGAGVWGGREGLPGGAHQWFVEPELISVGLMFVF